MIQECMNPLPEHHCAREKGGVPHTATPAQLDGGVSWDKALKALVPGTFGPGSADRKR